MWKFFLSQINTNRLFSWGGPIKKYYNTTDLFKSTSAFFFDMDGVLCRSEHLSLKAHTLSLQYIKKQYQLSFVLPTEKTIQSLIHGKTVKHAIEALGQHVPELLNIQSNYLSTCEKFYHEMQKTAKVNYLIEPSIKLLEEVIAAKFPVCIVSGSTRAEISSTLRLIGLENKVKFLGVEDYQYPKPHPEPYLQAASILSVTPGKDCIVFEDSTCGIQSAKAAGMSVVGLTTTLTARELNCAGADRVMNDLSNFSLTPTFKSKKITQNFERLEILRKNKPLVHNITNFVSMQNVANVLLAAGAAPLMAHALEELKDINKISNALVLNIGTLDETWVLSIKEAQKLAREKNIPIILDPVGAGVSEYRTKVALEILRGGVSIIRGNASEIKSLHDHSAITKGVESTEISTTVKHIAVSLSKQYSCVVVVSGATDIIVYKDENFLVTKPTKTFLTKVTGMGCAVTSLIGAYAATNPNYFEAACDAMVTLGIASEKAMATAKGPGQFFSDLLDNLYGLEELDYKLLNKVDKETVQIASTSTILNRQNTFQPNSKKILDKKKVDYSLYLVADLGYVGNDLNILIKKVKDVVSLEWGVTCVQLRAKTADKEIVKKAGKLLLAFLRPLGIPLIINDFLLVAKEIDADGVHLGQNDMSVKTARELLGKDKIIGLSITSKEDAAQCKDAPVDYFGVGPIFATTTKTDATASLNCDGLKAIQKIITAKPIIAIGGINISNITEVMQCQPAGIAVVSAILGAAAPQGATKTLRNIVNQRSSLQRSFGGFNP